MNLLKHESSPYLLQHANNPVYWKPWSEEAFEQARNENKPILVSIGYSSCHWCHVMEHESFEDQETADLMNALYVNIKVDREELPDVDHIYMDAVQAMTGSGGWPLNVFLTPDKKAFYGGTYFPPVRAHGRASWKEVLVNVSQYFSQNRNDVEAQADKLLTHIKQLSLIKKTELKDKEIDIDWVDLSETITKNLLQHADHEEGGFGMAPKFPSTFSIKYLLDDYALNGNENALQHALLSLDKMMMGGIYDQIGGGFSRYSTDKFWIAPHFEKMLYDNALLIEVYAIAFSITKQEKYKQVINETVAWLKREMMHDEFGFYSAQDADSEGIEGKYYTWNSDELKSILKDDYSWFASYYHVKEEGNWEHTNILYRSYESEKLLRENDKEKLRDIHAKLLEIRMKRIKPMTDDKQLLGWNALMNKALTTAYLSTGEKMYLQLAENNMEWLLRTFKCDEFLYLHTCRNGVVKIAAYADDLAYLSSALLQLSKVTAEISFSDKANEIVHYLELNFKQDGDAMYNFTNKKCVQVEVNKKEIFDSALPSPNSVICETLNQLYFIYQHDEWKNQHEAMLVSMVEHMKRYSNSFGNWAVQCLYRADLGAEVTIVGNEAKNIFLNLYTKKYKPNVTYITTHEESDVASLKGKYQQGETLIYICKDFSCLEALRDVNQAFVEI